MRIWVIILCALATGVAVGTMTTLNEFRDVDEIFDTRDGEVTITDSGPRVAVVNGATYDFGTMERYGTRSHTFLIKNTGNEPLTLRQLETTCKCTLSELEKTELKPGDTTEVSLEWTAKEVGPTTGYEQQAKIETNDPNRKTIVLMIRGRIQETLRTVPKQLTLTNVSATEGIVATAKLLSYVNETQVDVTKWEFVNPKLAPLMDLKVSPLAKDELGDEAAKNGVLLTIRIKPGLPSDDIIQTIRLTTNFPDSPVVHLAIEGNVAKDISIFGGGYDRGLKVLTIGRVKSENGARASLLVVARGADRKKVDFRVKRVVPKDLLQVKFGEKKEVNKGTAVHFPVEFEIKPGTRGVEFMSTETSKMGFIEFETGHPKLKEVKIYLRFAVDK